ncbi:gas vesicle protein [Marinobacter gelidimuriae]|uniref:gas vesicle protein n=1 Tax=Marinobacter gelidimuriae TaxID=2739064 RepID=UPI0038996B09
MILHCSLSLYYENAKTRCLLATNRLRFALHVDQREKHSTDSSTLADVLERILDKGVVIAGDRRGPQTPGRTRSLHCPTHQRHLVRRRDRFPVPWTGSLGGSASAPGYTGKAPSAIT